MRFDLTFNFPYDDSISNLEKRIEKINAFLRNHVNLQSDYQHFVIEIFQPNFLIDSCRRRSIKKFARNPEHIGNYLIGFFFFDNNNEEVGNLTLILDLGSELEEAIGNDVKACSAISSMELNEVNFSIVNNTICITFSVNDSSHFLSRHLTYVLNNLPIPDDLKKDS